MQRRKWRNWPEEDTAGPVEYVPSPEASAALAEWKAERTLMEQAWEELRDEIPTQDLRMSLLRATDQHNGYAEGTFRGRRWRSTIGLVGREVQERGQKTHPPRIWWVEPQHASDIDRAEWLEDIVNADDSEALAAWFRVAEKRHECAGWPARPGQR